MQNNLQAGIDQYNQVRGSDELDLITHVADILDNNGLGHKLGIYFENRFIKEGKDKTIEVQRFLLNRFWSHQLMQSAVPSHEERYSLIPNGTIDEWLRLFNSEILPFAIQNNLPL